MIPIFPFLSLNKPQPFYTLQQKNWVNLLPNAPILLLFLPSPSAKVKQLLSLASSIPEPLSVKKILFKTGLDFLPVNTSFSDKIIFDVCSISIYRVINDFSHSVCSRLDNQNFFVDLCNDLNTVCYSFSYLFKTIDSNIL